MKVLRSSCVVWFTVYDLLDLRLNNIEMFFTEKDKFFI